MSLTKSRFTKVLIISAILVSYLWGAFHTTWEALMNNISDSQIWQVAIEQSVQQEESSNFLSSLFSIPSAYADNGVDTSVYSKLKDIKGSVFEQSIIKAYQKWIIKWYSDWTFKPDWKVSFVESLAILIKSGPKWVQVQNYQTPSDTHWSDAYKALYNSQDKTTLRSFNNDDSITRDFAVYLMLRQIGVNLSDSDYSKIPHKFTDVNSTTKFKSYLAFANYVWISNWYGDWSFWVNKTVSRGELTTMAYRTLIDNKDIIIQKYNELMWSKWTTVQQPQVEVKQEVKVDNWYTTNEKWQKIGYWKDASFSPTSYQNLGKVFNEKGVIDYNNYKYEKDWSIPTPYSYISRSADGWFSLEFYKYMEEMKSQWKDISIPLYLVPSISYNWGWDTLTTNWFDLSTVNLSNIDIWSYPALKLLVTKAQEIEKTDHFTFKTDEASKFVQDNNLNAALAQDIYKLLTDNWISKWDYVVNWSQISYNWVNGIFKMSVTADGILSELLKNYKDKSNTNETKEVVNSYTRYQGGSWINLLISTYLQKLSWYELKSQTRW